MRQTETISDTGAVEEKGVLLPYSDRGQRKERGKETTT